MKNWAPARKRSAGNWGILCVRYAGRGEAGPRLRGKRGGKPGFSVFFTTRMGANPPAAPEAVHRFKVRDAGGAGSGSGWKSIRGRGWPRLYGACRI